MILFGRREVSRAEFQEETAAVRAELGRVASLMRTLEAEQSTLHDQVRKWMRRAIAAERNAAEGEPGPVTPAAVPPDSSATRRLTMWGARQRRLQRAREEAEGASNGVHP